jgi:hypothetical protein
LRSSVSQSGVLVRFAEKEKQIAALERQLALRNQNSTNSFQPPSLPMDWPARRVNADSKKKSRQKPAVPKTINTGDVPAHYITRKWRGANKPIF